MNYTTADIPDIRHDLHALHESRGEETLPEWYLGQCAQLDALEAVIKEQYQARLADVQRRRRALAWRWGVQFREAVERDLQQQQGKKRSVNYSTGRAGFRKSRLSLEIADEQMAVEWAVVHKPQAVKRTVSRTVLKEHLEQTGERPIGVIVHPAGDDRFYPAVNIGGFPDDVAEELREA